MRRASHRAHQSVQAHPVKLIAGEWSASRGSLPAPPVLPAAPTIHHNRVHLVELPEGIPRPELVPPAAKHGRQVRRSSAPPTLALRGGPQLLFLKTRQAICIWSVHTVRRVDSPPAPARAAMVFPFSVGAEFGFGRGGGSTNSARCVQRNPAMELMQSAESHFLQSTQHSKMASRGRIIGGDSSFIAARSARISRRDLAPPSLAISLTLAEVLRR